YNIEKGFIEEFSYFLSSLRDRVAGAISRSHDCVLFFCISTKNRLQLSIGSEASVDVPISPLSDIDSKHIYAAYAAAFRQANVWGYFSGLCLVGSQFKPMSDDVYSHVNIAHMLDDINVVGSSIETASSESVMFDAKSFSLDFFSTS
ncbi:hypothetical protein ADUPG1_005349, partial [Aduncisulcus paluster]